jgi:hypothetical protein
MRADYCALHTRFEGMPRHAATIVFLALFTGAAAAAPIIVGVDAGGRVPTNPSATWGPATFTFTVMAAPFEVVLDLDINIDMVHSWTEDLDITLTSPDPPGPAGPISVLLFNHRGSVPAFADLNDTYFDDDAANPISAGVPPFAGPFRPENPLVAFNGLDPHGIWTLTINDSYFGDYGWLYRAGDPIFERRRAPLDGTYLRIVVPEPASAVLLFAGALTLLRPRRKCDPTAGS